MLKVMLFIPSNLSVNISKNLNKSMYNFFMYNSYIKVNAFLPLKHFLISFDIETNTVLIIAISCNSYIKQYITNLMLTYNAFFKINFKKLKFKGKGYYIYRNARNTIAPQFGYAHRLYIYSWFNALKFSSKTTLLLFGFINDNIQAAALNLKSFRRINVFTGRGVRFSRQCIYSKPGKISTYR